MCADVLIAHAGAELYGSDRMVIESVRAFVSDGRDVVVTVPREGPLVEALTDAGASVWVCETPIINKSLLSPRGLVSLLVQTCRAAPVNLRLIARSGAPVVVVNTITVPLWLPLARLAGRRVVCHVHEAEASARAWLRRLLYLPATCAQRIVINSRFALGVLGVSAPWLRSRTRIVYNAVAGPPAVRPVRRELSAPVRVLFIGRLSARKGPDVAVEALALLAPRGVDATLSLLGEVFEGNEAFKDALVERVRALGLEDRVEFLGFRPGIWDVVAEHDVVCVPSTVDEPFGNTAVEAALGGRPLVVSAIAGLLEAAEGAESAIAVPPGNPEAIADALVRIVADWDAYAEAAARDQRRAGTRFSSERYGRELRRAVLDELQ